jgi:hypothetical protein
MKYKNNFTLVAVAVGIILVVVGFCCHMESSEIPNHFYDHLYTVSQNDEAVKNKIDECMSDGKISREEYREIVNFDKTRSKRKLVENSKKTK